MKSPFRIQYRYSWLSIVGIAAIAAILTYNTWMVSCGQCSPRSLLTIPWVGWLLISLNALAAVLLFFLRHRSHVLRKRHECPACAVPLNDSWRYCPACGRSR